MFYLALNKGSSSLKFCLYSSKSISPILSGKLTNYKPEEYSFVFTFQGESKNIPVTSSQYLDASVLVLNLIKELQIVDDFSEIIIVHRVVHGGNKFIQPTLLNKQVIEDLELVSKLAPLHNPPVIAEIKLLWKTSPQLQQIAVFDTSFHESLPEINQIYGLPIIAYTKYGIKRFGFHGLSHSFVSNEYYRLKSLENPNIPDKYIEQTDNQLDNNPNNKIGKIICLHLGSGSSLCAIKNGESYQTSMGFSPNEGLPMATRSGDINFEAINYYMEKAEIEAKDIPEILNKKSGVLGISGYTNNFVDLVKDYETNSSAKLALDYFVEKVVEKLGGYIAALGGVEAIIFTGAIGEGSSFIRRKICERFGFMSLFLDQELNLHAGQNNPGSPSKDLLTSAEIISSVGSKIQVWVIPTGEELQMVSEARKMLNSNNLKF